MFDLLLPNAGILEENEVEYLAHPTGESRILRDVEANVTEIEHEQALSLKVFTSPV